jgi:hypothetical protein
MSPFRSWTRDLRAPQIVASGCEPRSTFLRFPIRGIHAGDATFLGRGLCAPLRLLAWAGARYTVVKDVDLVGAYYHYTQPAYGVGCTSGTAATCFRDGGRGFRPYRLAVLADMGHLHRHHVLPGEWRALERLSRPQYARHHSRRSPSVFNPRSGYARPTMPVAEPPSLLS